MLSTTNIMVHVYPYLFSTLYTTLDFVLENISKLARNFLQRKGKNGNGFHSIG